MVGSRSHASFIGEEETPPVAPIAVGSAIGSILATDAYQQQYIEELKKFVNREPTAVFWDEAKNLDVSPSEYLNQTQGFKWMGDKGLDNVAAHKAKALEANKRAAMRKLEYEIITGRKIEAPSVVRMNHEMHQITSWESSSFRPETNMTRKIGMSVVYMIRYNVTVLSYVDEAIDAMLVPEPDLSAEKLWKCFAVVEKLVVGDTYQFLVDEGLLGNFHYYEMVDVFSTILNKPLGRFPISLGKLTEPRKLKGTPDDA